ncbi:MAG: ESX secretion-associated protein EspG, partial [Sciscionella sp.]
LAASDAGTSVLAILDDEYLELRPVDPRALAESLVDLAVPCPARAGRTLSVPVSEIDEHGRALAPATTTFTSVNEPGPSADAERLERLLSEPRSGAGQLYVAQRDAAGRRRRCRHPINYLDTTSGRVYTSVVVNTIGEDSIIATPATGQTLVDRVREMHRTLG